MKIQRTDKRLVSFIGACIIVLLSTTCVCAQKIGNPLDTLKKEKGGDQRDSVEGKRDSRKFSERLSGLFNTLTEPKKPKKSKKGERLVVYKGYSKKFMEIKELMKSGEPESVTAMYAEQDKGKSYKKIGYLGLLERGTLATDQGNSENAVERFYYAEQILKDREKECLAKEKAKKGFSLFLQTVTGYEESGPYWGEPYEKILLLNYKTIAYLLQGDRKAYNVTRRAIDWQNMAKKVFEEKVREAKIKLGQEQKDQHKKGDDSSKLNFKKIIAGQFSGMDAKASTVASAYVNPFGFYVAGIIQELESDDDPSLRKNALISYKKALELNPHSRVIQQAVKELKKEYTPSGTKLVHVVVGEGFVPEKKVLEFWIDVGEVIPIKLPIYEPTSSRVQRIEVYTSDGKRLACLSPVADIEAICLRHQKDMQPFYMLRVMLAAGSSYVIKKALDELGLIGRLFSFGRDKMSSPDTRSWMSLPATIQAARLRVPKGLKRIRIVSYGEKGQELASETVDLDTSTHNFVYARSIDNVLYSYPNKKLWLAKK